MPLAPRQVVDDILDITQTTEQLGKTAGKDLASDKTTYPSILGLDQVHAYEGSSSWNAYRSAWRPLSVLLMFTRSIWPRVILATDDTIADAHAVCVAAVTAGGTGPDCRCQGGAVQLRACEGRAADRPR